VTIEPPVSSEPPAHGPSACGLAPVAVLPRFQGQGIGSALIRSGLSRCRDLDWQVVFVVGEPAYYSRFGFMMAAPLGLHYESEAFDEAFQVRELTRGALANRRGWVRYHAAFGNV
jgi:putative acetyltransferase